MGLYNYKARFYSTTLGRFLSVDPMVGGAGDPQSWNAYTYVRNNPLRLIDPTGMRYEDGSTPNGYVEPQHPAVVHTCSLLCLQLKAAKRAYDQAAHKEAMRKGMLAGKAISDAAAAKWTAAVAAAEGILPKAGRLGLTAAGAGSAIFAAELIGAALISSSDSPQMRIDPPSAGTPVYRVHGDKAEPDGHWWSTLDPRTVPNYRSIAGLPNTNSGEYLSIGILTNSEGVVSLAATPLEGHPGGLPSIWVPHPQVQISVIRVETLVPPY